MRDCGGMLAPPPPYLLRIIFFFTATGRRVEGHREMGTFPELRRWKVDFIFRVEVEPRSHEHRTRPRPAGRDIRARRKFGGDVVFPGRVKSYFNFSSRRKCHLSTSPVPFLIMLRQDDEKKMNSSLVPFLSFSGKISMPDDCIRSDKIINVKLVSLGTLREKYSYLWPQPSIL